MQWTECELNILCQLYVIVIVKYSSEGWDFWSGTGQNHYLNEWRDFLWLKLVTCHAKLVLC